MRPHRNSTSTFFTQQPTISQPKKYRLLVCQWLIALLCLFPLTSSALETDRTKPIEVSADQATLDDKKNVAVYEGQVKLTQGSLTIKADKLSISASKDGQVSEIIATGNLAEFTQIPEPDKDPVVAKAKQINYNVSEEKIVLTHSASVVQNKNLFQGNTITYDIKQQKLSASGPTETIGEPSGRVKMILPPPTQTKPVERPADNQTINNEKATDTNEQTDSVSSSKELQE